MQRTPRSTSARSKKKQETPRNKKLANAAIIGMSALLVAGLGAAVVQDQQAQAGANPAPSYTPTVAPPEDYKALAVIGDSYTGGSNEGGYKQQGWVAEVTEMLNADGDEIKRSYSGLGGSGYVAEGPTGKVFGEAIGGTITDNTDVVVFFGSINDEQEDIDDIGDAAAEAYAQVKKDHPDVTLVVAGPAWIGSEVPEKIQQVNDVLENRAKDAGAVWIDPIEERWFFDDPQLIGEDRIHPTDAGHDYMAKKFAPHLEPLLE